MTRMGDNLRSLREARGLSQGQVAKMVGKTRSAISQYESGAIVPRMGTLEALDAAVDGAFRRENRRETPRKRRESSCAASDGASL